MNYLINLQFKIIEK